MPSGAEDLPELTVPDEPGGARGPATLEGLPGDRYRPVARLGAGAFGEVQRAPDRLLGRDVAVKRIRLEAFVDPGRLDEVKKRFLREAQVAAASATGTSSRCLFSLGCVLYECLTGTRPFQSPSVSAILVKILTEDPPPVDPEALGLPRALQPVLLRATAKDPSARYPSGEAMTNESWVGDYHEAPILYEPRTDSFRTIHLCAAIDHYSKLVPHGQWYPNERTLEDAFKKAILKRGCPREELRRICGAPHIRRSVPSRAMWPREVLLERPDRTIHEDADGCLVNRP